MTINVDENGSYYRDLLIDTPYTFRPEDPKEYGFICPVCFVRYGKPGRYIEVERCVKCPPYIDGIEIHWNFTGKKRAKLKELGYFSLPAKGGRKKKQKKDGVL